MRLREARTDLRRDPLYSVTGEQCLILHRAGLAVDLLELCKRRKRPALYFISNYVYPAAATKQKKQLLASMGFAGQVIGQLCKPSRGTGRMRAHMSAFGWISDKIGRKVRRRALQRADMRMGPDLAGSSHAGLYGHGVCLLPSRGVLKGVNDSGTIDALM